jgi:hypothetical protein
MILDGLDILAQSMPDRSNPPDSVLQCAFNLLEDRYLRAMSQPAILTIRNESLDRSRRAARAVILVAITALCLLPALPCQAFDLFTRHEVTAQFATPDGKPMAHAEVRAFAPGDPNTPAVTGRTDAEGKFVFDADRDGFWSAEARGADYVTRIMIRVGGEQQSQNWLSPFLVVGVLVVLLAIAVWYRLLRARTHRPRS